MKASTGKVPSPRRVLMIVENLPVPFDRRVWSEATTLRAAGYDVSVICPLTPQAPERDIVIDGIQIYRHKLPGRVDDSTLFTVLSTADVCVNPDRPSAMNDKSTMNKIMEYMAFARPIVQYDLTEGRYSAGEASLYARNTDVADFGDKIVELLDAPERRRIMGAFGERRVRDELAWAHEAPKLLRAYDSLFEEAGGP